MTDSFFDYHFNVVAGKGGASFRTTGWLNPTIIYCILIQRLGYVWEISGSWLGGDIPGGRQKVQSGTNSMKNIKEKGRQELIPWAGWPGGSGWHWPHPPPGPAFSSPQG